MKILKYIALAGLLTLVHNGGANANFIYKEAPQEPANTGMATPLLLPMPAKTVVEKPAAVTPEVASEPVPIMPEAATPEPKSPEQSMPEPQPFVAPAAPIPPPSAAPTAPAPHDIHPLQPDTIPCDCGMNCAGTQSIPLPIKAEPRSLPLPPLTVIGNEERTVYFTFDGDDLSAEARDRLDSLAERLRTADDVTGTTIVGYADRKGTFDYNDQLSHRRAEHVRSYLIERGLTKPSVTETRWVGKTEATAVCSDSTARDNLLRCLQPDRKVEVEIHYKSTDTARAAK